MASKPAATSPLTLFLYAENTLIYITTYDHPIPSHFLIAFHWISIAAIIFHILGNGTGNYILNVFVLVIHKTTGWSQHFRLMWYF